MAATSSGGPQGVPFLTDGSLEEPLLLHALAKRARLTAPTLTRPGISPVKRRQRRSLHHLALALVLCALLAVVGTGSVWSADEGAFLYQVSSLTEGEGWSFPHPFPEADPAGTAYPLHLSAWSPDQRGPGEPCPVDGVTCRYIPFAKHVAYLWVGVALFKLGGYTALVALSVAGTLGAAIATSRLARGIEHEAELPALWIAGLGSPLLLNGFIGWAHTPTAALLALAVLWLLPVAPEDPEQPGHRSLLRPAFGLAALGLACLLRTEAPLAGVAIGLGWLGLARFDRRKHRSVDDVRHARHLGRLGGAVLAVTAIATAADRMTARPTNGPVEPPVFGQAFGYVGGRVEGFVNTWLKPGYVTRPMDVLPLVAAASLFAGAILIRRRSEHSGMAALAALCAVACLALRFALSPPALIPGLLVAFPLLFVGLVLLDRRTLTDRRIQALLIPFLLFCSAVLATQYRTGGGSEWGGRYFAAGLPLGIAVASVGLVRFHQKLGSNGRVRIVLLVVASVLLVQGMGVVGIRSIRNRTAELEAAVLLSSASGVAGDGEKRPVVVTTMNGLGRWLWDDLDSLRMLRVTDEDLPDLGRTLGGLGITRFTLVSNHPVEDSERFAPRFEPTEAPTGLSPVVTLQATVKATVDGTVGE